MSRITFLILVIILGFSSQVLAGYSEMKKILDDYQPPGSFMHQSRSPYEPREPPNNNAFSMEKKRIEELKSTWEKALRHIHTKDFFLIPDPGLLKSLESTETDVTMVENQLNNTFFLKSLEIMALLRNPGIRAAKNRFRGALEAFTQVSALDEILLRYSAFTRSLRPGIGPMKGKDAVNMKFPFPGILSLKAAIVNQEVIVRREDLEKARREAVAGIRKAYWNLVFTHNATDINTQMLGLLKYLEAVANSRYESGKTSYQDIIKIRINRKTLEEDLITLKEKQHNYEYLIREILNLPSNIRMGLPAKVRPSDKIPALQTLYGIAGERNQELRRLRAKVMKMEQMIEMAETMILPPYTLNLSIYGDDAVSKVGSLSQKETFPSKTSSSGGAGLPKKPWFGIEDSYLRETRENLLALREELRKTEMETQTKVRYAWFDLDRSNRETSLYRDEVVTLSKSALDVSTKGYESGNVLFADVIDSYTTWLNANLLFERNQSNTGIARAELERVVGMSLK